MPPSFDYSALNELNRSELVIMHSSNGPVTLAATAVDSTEGPHSMSSGTTLCIVLVLLLFVSALLALSCLWSHRWNHAKNLIRRGGGCCCGRTSRSSTDHERAGRRMEGTMAVANDTIIRQARVGTSAFPFPTEKPHPIHIDDSKIGTQADDFSMRSLPSLESVSHHYYNYETVQKGNDPEGRGSPPEAVRRDSSLSGVTIVAEDNQYAPDPQIQTPPTAHVVRL